MTCYAYEVVRDDGAYLIRFPDVPEAITVADTADAIEADAIDCLVTALAGYVLDGRSVPGARQARSGERVACLPVLDEAKLELLRALTETGTRRTDLARLLDVDEKAVRRLLDFDHQSHIGQIERALAMLGRRLEVSVEPAA